MDKKVERTDTYFDSTEFREQLTALAHDYSKNQSKLRAMVLERLSGLVDQARRQAEVELKEDGNGRRCAENLSVFQDELISILYDFTIHHIYRAKNPSDAERMVIVATGGYGRGLLAPGSDIDLLFLLPYKQTAWGESVVEYILYILWDLGFNVGHATRSVEQSIRLAKSDMTIRTTLLDSRLIWGDEELYSQLENSFDNQIVTGSEREFIEAKLAEQDQRHMKSGVSRYLVEPNIKDGKGGLRDLHTLHWLVKYLSDEEAQQDLVAAGVFSPEEYHTYRKCEDFLWTVRCHLHFLTGRPEERLSFDVQPEMAERLGYTTHAGLQAVERFMKHYFLVAKDVGDLTRIVCAALEIKQLKKAPRLNRFLETLSWRNKSQPSDIEGFKIENGRINYADTNVFKRDPVNLIRLFWLAEENNVPFHPEVIRLVRGSLRLINNKLCANDEANELFLKLLTDESSPENALRKMNEAGVLGRFVPDFGRIVSMMQFNMYHHFTVDEHLIRAVGILNEIETGNYTEEHPLSTNIIHTIKNRRALYVAIFLHDIAKGRKDDHSIAGARIARKLCPRFGLTDEETDTVVWLVENHLVMSQFAQSRDINDPKTIQDFAQIVQSPERLNLLIVLTVADIRAVGPGVWNGWKGQLLRALYYETEPIVSGGRTQTGRQDIISEAKEKLRQRLSDWPEDRIEHYLDCHYPGYWLRTETDRQVEHANLVERAESLEEPLATIVTTDSFTAITAISIYAPSHPRLLAMITGACAAAGANILDAQISTTKDGMALDTICIQREFERHDDEKRRAERITQTMRKLLTAEISLKSLTSAKREPKGRIRAFRVEPEVVIDNSLSNKFTVIEVRGLDRPGLLFDLTDMISNLSLDISSAHIATFGEKAVDVFYVTDLLGKKIQSDARRSTVRTRLLSVLKS